MVTKKGTALPKPKKVKAATERERQAELMSRKRAVARDIEIPAVVDAERREACRFLLYGFATTYFPHLYYLPPAQYQIERIEKIQRLVLSEGLAADAHPRGSGKTTDAIVAAVWAVVYGHKSHFFVIRANKDEARAFVTAIQTELETNELLLEDFPEVCAPIRALEGAAQRCGSQTVGGVRTRMVYQSDHIVFPTVAGSVASGAVISAEGITGKIRGRNVNGLRPDFVLLDDIEDAESVKSPGVSGKLERIILRDIGGLAGPGKRISTLWRGTIIERNCLIDLYTDRTEHPEWEGSRQASILSWPENETLWEKYLKLLAEGKRGGEDPHGREALAFYIKNRAAMDKGAIVAWEHNFISTPAPDGSPAEVSALQHAYNTIARIGMDAYRTEYQNDPPDEPGFSGITRDLILSRLSGLPRYFVPEWAEYLVQGMDVGARELHYEVWAVASCGTSALIDYDIIEIRGVPEGENLRGADGLVRQALENATLEALRERRVSLDEGTTPYRDEQDKPRPVALTLIDSGYATTQRAVYAFCRESGARWRACKGAQAGTVFGKYASPLKSGKGVLLGDRWYGKYMREHSAWLWTVDADAWKLFVHERFLQDMTTGGAAMLYGESPEEHVRFAKHLLAEDYSAETGKWTQRRRFNHYFDCAAYAMAAANMLGVKIVASASPLQNTGPEAQARVAQAAQRARREQDNAQGSNWAASPQITTPDGRPFFIMER